jgi:hypothetical protein
MQNQRLTDNIFLDTRRQGAYTAYPVKNVLSYMMENSDTKESANSISKHYL